MGAARVVREGRTILRRFSSLIRNLLKWSGHGSGAGNAEKIRLGDSVRDVPGLYHRSPPAPSPGVFSQVFILKLVKVLCFDTLLQVFILKVVTASVLLNFFETPRPAGWPGRRGSSKT